MLLLGAWLAAFICVDAPNNSCASATEGATHARVVIVHDPQATEAFKTRPENIRAMVRQGITNLTHTTTVTNAWLSLVKTNDVVGIKVYSVPGPDSGTRPAVVAAIVEELLEAGLAPTNIVIWDKQSTDLRLAGFYDFAPRYGVRLASTSRSGFDTNTFYENPLLGNLVWGDVEFGKKSETTGRKSFVSSLVSHELTKIINVSPLLNHTLAGVSGNIYGLAVGCVDNVARFETEGERMAVAIPEIYNLPTISDKVVLNVVDALICQYEGGERGLLHYSSTLNELRFSKDPVALDVLSLTELERQRAKFSTPNGKLGKDLYTNAGLLELGVSDPKLIDIENLP